MTNIEMKIVLLACMATLGYFVVSTASQLHAANERLAAVEMRMGRVEAGSVSSTGKIVHTDETGEWVWAISMDDGYWLDARRSRTQAEAFANRHRLKLKGE